MKFLSIEYHPGFVVYKNGRGPVWVCPHTGPAIEVSTSRDQWSDTIASQCWLKMGGTLIVSTIPRKQMYGMDYNREMPPEQSSLNVWSDFVTDENREKLYRYRKEYAWTALNDADHRHRQKIYSDFWRTVMRSGNIIVFLHSSFVRVKNFPCVMDVITYQGRGVKNELIDAIVKKTNQKYEPFFRRIAEHYKNGICHEHTRIVDRVKEIFSDFDLGKMKVEFKNNVMEDMKVLERYSDPAVYRKLTEEFNEENYMTAVRSAMDNKEVCPNVTVESIFKGQKAMKMKSGLFKEGNIVMEVETSRFLGYWYPKQASEIVMDILGDVISIDMYKRMGAKQTDMLKFIRNGGGSDENKAEAVQAG